MAALSSSDRGRSAGDAEGMEMENTRIIAPKTSEPVIGGAQDLLVDRLACHEGLAHRAPRHEPLQEPQVLDVERLVEPEGLLHLVDALRRRRLPRRQACQVGRHDEEDPVCDERGVDGRRPGDRLTRYRATSS